jgi:uncharacterized membrane protein YoaK (UPF0700 family)
MATLQASLLATIAGYADAVGYLRFHAFAGMMTGNTILFSIALIERDRASMLSLAVIIAGFAAGVIAARLALRADLPSLAVGLAAGGAIAAAAWAPDEVAAPLLAAAMGAQNATANRFGGVALNTVFLTGNLQKICEELVARLWPGRRLRDPAPGGLAILSLVWLGYAVGAALGAAATATLALPLLPAALLLPVALFRAPADHPAGAEARSR